MMSPEIMQLMMLLSVMFGPAGAAYVGVKVSLNGTRERVKRIEEKLDDYAEDAGDVRERVSVLESRVDVLL